METLTCNVLYPVPTPNINFAVAYSTVYKMIYMLSGVLRNGSSNSETRALCFKLQDDLKRYERIDNLP